MSHLKYLIEYWSFGARRPTIDMVEIGVNSKIGFLKNIEKFFQKSSLPVDSATLPFLSLKDQEPHTGNCA